MVSVEGVVGPLRQAVDYRLTEAAAADAAWLDELRRRAYARLFTSTWGRWDEARHQRHFAACMEEGCISVIHVEDERVGMLQLFEHPEEMEIGELQIDPIHQRRGIGTTILQDVVHRADARGCSVRLRVGLENTGARRLYERLGFEEVSRTDTHFMMKRPPRGRRT